MTASKAWQETVAEGEDALFLRLAEALQGLQRASAAGGPMARGLHAKAIAGVRGIFTVKGDLPEPARQGLFAEARRYDAYVRFSNGSGRRQADRVPDVRGIAIKVVGVEGQKVIAALGDARTQDFLLIQSAALPFRSPEEFVAFIVAASGGQALLLPRLIGALGLVRPFTLLRDVLGSVGSAAHSVALQRYHSAAPIAFGPYAAKLDLLPAQAGAAAKPSLPDHYTTDLVERLKAGPLRYTLRAQFFVDEASTPIESSTQIWSEEASPFVAIAELELPQQDLTSDEGRARAERVEALSFDPWHAKIEHRPLGAVMRARNHAYRLSTSERGAAAEPTEVV